MQINAIYDKGRLEFLEPVRFVQKTFPVRVEVPEHVMESTDKKPAFVFNENDAIDQGTWPARLQAIKQQVMQISDNDLPVLTEKQKTSMRAFELREVE
jgi:hypothetical protein